MPIAFDFETSLIRPGMQHPPGVCMSWRMPEREGVMVAREGVEWLERWLKDGESFVGANTAFDVLVSVVTHPDPGVMLDLWIAAYEDDRVHDVLIRQKLLDLAAGRYRYELLPDGRWRNHSYALDDVVARHSRRRLDKTNPWRLRFAELAHLPINEYPREAYDYSLDDAIGTGEAFDAQEIARFNDPKIRANFPGMDPLKDEPNQVRAALALAAMADYGLRTDPALVDALNVETVAALEEIRNELVGLGIVRERKIKRRATGIVEVEYSRNTKAAQARQVEAYRALGREAPHTDSYKPEKHKPDECVCLDSDACEGSQDPVMQTYSEYTSLAKTISNDIPMLRLGATQPIHTHFEVILETGRTSSAKPNVQNVRRLPGIRECFVPSPGRVFASADFSMLELVTLAQTCKWVLGWSALADALNDGKDPHLQMAATILGITYDEAKRRKSLDDPLIDQARTAGKGVNFGAPGGLGKATFAHYAWKAYKIKLGANKDESEAAAAKLIRQYKDTWTEMPQYFTWVNQNRNDSGSYNMVQPWSERLRANATYCSACNTPFQGLGADCAKLALWLVFVECYTVPESPLFGAWPCNFIHDEIVLDVEEHQAHDAAMRLSELMQEAGRHVMPDLPIKAEPLVSRQWSKKAKPRYGADGRLVPWDMYVAAVEVLRKKEATRATARATLTGWPSVAVDRAIQEVFGS